jgi:hypothetical protein
MEAKFLKIYTSHNIVSFFIAHYFFGAVSCILAKMMAVHSRADHVHDNVGETKAQREDGEYPFKTIARTWPIARSRRALLPSHTPLPAPPPPLAKT